MIIDAAVRALEALKAPVNANDDKDLNGGVGGLTGGAGAGDFMSYMSEALQGTGKSEVSEEELFSLLLGQRIGEVSEEAKDHFLQAKTEAINSIRRADGYVNLEEAAVQALQSTVEEGLLDSSEGDRIYAESFMGAQLDGNTNELWDDRGSASDPTIAIATIDEALGKLEIFMNSLTSGTLDSSNLSMDNPAGATSSGSLGGGMPGASQSQQLDGAGGFLWKPVSESDKKLVVLLPEALRGAVSRVEIHASLPPSDITKLGEGRFAGDTMNGNRPHFRFDKPGSDYGDDVHVVAYKDDGSMLTWGIKDGGARHD